MSDHPPSPALPTSLCQHEDFRATVAVNHFEDTGRFMADVRVECAQCGEPFRFVGLPAGVHFDKPLVSIDGCELHAPIEPQGEQRLLGRATFNMPKIPKSN